MNDKPNTSTRFFLDRTIMAVALLMIAYHFFSVWFPVFNPILHQNIHLGFCLTLLFLMAVKGRGNVGRLRKTWLLVCMTISIGAIIFVHTHYERLSMWAGFPEQADVVVGFAMVAMIIYLTWMEWGLVFPALVLSSIAYALWGHHLTGPLSHPLLEPKLILSSLAIGLEGTYGMMLNASANLIFLFIIFGSLFSVVGIDNFFIELGNYFGGFIRGGAAQTAIIASSFVGMCTGSAPANVALTGSYTIPLMKKTGFKGRHAAAIEAAASSGGQLTPPIMGIAVFIMAGFLGMDYGSLMLTALIPAVFYYGIIVVGSYLIASRDGIPKLKTDINKKILSSNAPVFAISMTVLTVLLILHFSPGYATSYAIAAMLGVAVLKSSTRPNIKILIGGLTKGAVSGASIGVACATIGMFMKMLTVTGGASKLASLSQTLAGDNLIAGLVYAMCLSIILGCAMPIVVAYVICAIVVSPVLVDMGLPMITAHFFVFYFAVLSAVTPPIAAAAMVGSRIAESDYMKTGYEAFKLILPFFLVPYFLVANPIVMLRPQSFFSASAALTALFIACGTGVVFVHGFFLIRTSMVERTGYLGAAILATIYGLYGNFQALAGALVLTVILMLTQIKKKKEMGSVTAAI